MLGALPALLLRTRHHDRSHWGSAAAALVFGAALAAVAAARPLPWPLTLGLSLLGLFGYAVCTGLLTTLVAQVLPDRFAIVFGAVNFLALAVATTVQQTGVALDYEASTGYYFMCGIVACVGAALLFVAALLYCRKPADAGTALEEAHLI